MKPTQPAPRDITGVEEDGHLAIRLCVPGLAPEDISVTVTDSEGLDADAVTTTFEDGVLAITIRLPRRRANVTDAPRPSEGPQSDSLTAASGFGR